MNLRPTSKRLMMEGLLSSGYMQVCLKQNTPSVVLPDTLKLQPEGVTLDFGDSMAIPIPDLTLDDVGIKGTLSFNTTPFYVVIPWEAVFYMSSPSGGAATWLNDYPPALRRQMDTALTVYDDEQGTESTPEVSTSTVTAKKERPSWMKVV